MNKVAIYIISDGIGGAEQLVMQTIKSLKDQLGIFLIVNNEISNFYSGLLDGYKILNVGGIYLHRNPSFRMIRYLLNNRFYSIKPLLVKSKTRKVCNFLKNNGISTVHAHMEFALFSALNIKSRLSAIKVIYTVHSAFGFLGNKSLKPQYRISNNEFSAVDIFVFVSRYNLNLFRTNKVPVKDFRLIYNSINLRDLPAKSPGKTEVGNFDILYVGGAKFVKGYDLLVNTVKELTSDFNLSKLRITVLGEVSPDSEFVNLINKNGLWPFFDILGFIVPPEHYQYFQQADLLFMPSRSEAMPMAAVEALFFNIPIVASNVGGLPEIISNGMNGYLCSPDAPEFAKAIFCSIQTHGQLQLSTKKYNESIRNVFDSEVVMKQLYELYYKINEVKNNER